MNIIVNKDISIKAFVIISIFAIILGISNLDIAIKGYLNVNILKKDNKVEAKITYSSKANVSKKIGETNYQRKVEYIYTINNKEYKGQDILWWRVFAGSDRNIQVGDKITVFYNINNPTESEVYHISYVLIVVGICFIVVPILALKQRIKEK